MSPAEQKHRFRELPELRDLFRGMEKDGVLPHFEAKTIVGMHGTSRERAEKILTEGMNPTLIHPDFLTQDDVLGEGQYFWEESGNTGGLPIPAAAMRWAKHRYPELQPAALVGALVFERMFDLIHPQNAEFALQFKGRVKKSIAGHKKIEGSQVIGFWEEARFTKLLVLSCPQLAEANVDGIRWNGLGLPDYYEISQTGTCVKDANCIKKLDLFTT